MSNRRNFLKNSLLGTLGIGLTPAIAAAETRNPKSKETPSVATFLAMTIQPILKKKTSVKKP